VGGDSGRGKEDAAEGSCRNEKESSTERIVPDQESGKRGICEWGAREYTKTKKNVL